MIQHIVCFKLANPTEELLKNTRSILLQMETKTPTVKEISVGIDELHSQRSYDIILMVKVDSWEALDEYQKDPFHCNVVKKHMHAIAQSSIALDYEL